MLGRIARVQNEVPKGCNMGCGQCEEGISRRLESKIADEGEGDAKGWRVNKRSGTEMLREGDCATAITFSFL